MGRLWILMVTFFQIGLFSIGGGYAIIPLIQEQVVEKYGWVSEKIFTDIITISQMTPGPLAVNTSTFIGLQIAGIPGAIIATFGCVVAGIIIGVSLYCFFQKYQKSIYIISILSSLKAASLGLIVSAAATILLLTFAQTSNWNRIGDIDWLAVTVFSGSFLVLRKWKTNPILLMVVAGCVGVFIYC